MTDPIASGPKARTADDVRVSRIVANNVRRLREAQRISMRTLAATIQANGHRTNFSSLTRIEIGHHANGSLRPVTVDELTWLAEALTVRPEQLLGTLECQSCNGEPAPGFTCNTCGAGTPAA